MELKTESINLIQPVSLHESMHSRWETWLDFISFIVNSIGFIIKEIFHMAVGYPEKELKSDIALITGGGSGLGRLLAQRLGETGTKVVIWDINKEGIKETVEMVQEAGGFCRGYVVDVSKKDEVYKAAEVIQKEIGDISLLINNAGVVSGLHFLDTPDHLIERSFNVNVMAHFWTTKAFLPKMIENERGHITTIASLAGHVGITKLVDYCASKFAAVGFDEALRLELDVLGHKNIHTTCVCPFFIQATGMFDNVYARWLPTLNPNNVADRVIIAIRRKEKIAIIPGYIRLLLSLKWAFPWGCNAGLLRRLVPDAAPYGIARNRQTHKISSSNSEPPTDLNTSLVYDKNTSSLTKNSDFSESAIPKSASLLVQRTPFIGERVL